MRRQISFTLFCMGVLFIATFVYAGPVQSANASMLSDQEMAQVTGTCTCYEIEHNDCLKAGDEECTLASSCPSEMPRFHDPLRYTCSSAGETNNKKCSDGNVPCWTPTNVVPNGTLADHECTNEEPPGYDPEVYSGFYVWCKYAEGQTCIKCKWGIPAGSSAMKEDDDCVPM